MVVYSETPISFIMATATSGRGSRRGILESRVNVNFSVARFFGYVLFVCFDKGFGCSGRRRVIEDRK